MYTIGPLTEVYMGLFLSNNRFNVKLILADYQLRWWRLPIEETSLPQNTFGWRWLLVEEFWTPPSLKGHLYEVISYERDIHATSSCRCWRRWWPVKHTAFYVLMTFLLTSKWRLFDHWNDQTFDVQMTKLMSLIWAH